MNAPPLITFDDGLPGQLRPCMAPAQKARAQGHHLCRYGKTRIRRTTPDQWTTCGAATSHAPTCPRVDAPILQDSLGYERREDHFLKLAGSPGAWKNPASSAYRRTHTITRRYFFPTTTTDSTLPAPAAAPSTESKIMSPGACHASRKALPWPTGHSSRPRISCNCSVGSCRRTRPTAMPTSRIRSR